MPTGRVSVKVEGLSELIAGLEELTKATATNVQKRALKEAAAPIEADAKLKAPRLTGLLQRSIDIGSKLSPRQRSSPKLSKVEVYVGPPSMERGIVAEFGSVKQSPKPFMRPAWDANKTKALATIKDNLKTEIDKAAQRAARKAAKIT